MHNKSVYIFLLVIECLSNPVLEYLVNEVSDGYYYSKQVNI